MYVFLPPRRRTPTACDSHCIYMPQAEHCFRSASAAKPPAGSLLHAPIWRLQGEGARLRLCVSLRGAAPSQNPQALFSRSWCVPPSAPAPASCDALDRPSIAVPPPGPIHSRRCTRPIEMCCIQHILIAEEGSLPAVQCSCKRRTSPNQPPMQPAQCGQLHPMQCPRSRQSLGPMPQSCWSG